MSKKIMVTGGAGFIGSHLVAALELAGREVIICDRLRDSGKWHNVGRRTPSEIIHPDAMGDYLQREGRTLEAVVHLGAISSPNERDAVLALGSDDGVVVWLDGKRAHTNLVPRGYSSREDRVPIRLKAGRNALLLKITQGGGGWCFGAHLEDARGGPLEGVKTSLDPSRE